MFTLYSSPLADIAHRHDVSIHMYADDTQLYLPFDPNSAEGELLARHRVEKCISEMKSWMLSNKLKLNDEKSELLILSPKQQIRRVMDESIKVGDTVVKAVPAARNLGAMFDNVLSMDRHIKKICQAAYFQIRNVNSIRKTLCDKSAAIIIHALILHAGWTVETLCL